MPARSLAVWLTLFCTAAVAQVHPPLNSKGGRPRIALERSGVVQTFRSPVSSQASAADTIRILAVMIDFQTSPNSYTTGDGHFLLTPPTSTNVIDPAPHDSSYFAYKLQ
ncbi:MAG TPA: hypothetical protein VMH23_10340, partial [Bacteroidota bacterium]|nr:hypothetical protein [Bacteroidota bacterium]